MFCTLRSGLLVAGLTRATTGFRVQAAGVRAHWASGPRLASKAAAIVVVMTCGSVEAQSPETGAVAFRPLGSFRFLHIPVAAGDQGKLSRELVRQMQGNDELWPAPFGWKIEPSLRSDAGPDDLLASVRPHPSIKAGVVVEFTDVNGRPIAVVEGEPAPLRRTAAASIGSVISALNDVYYATRGADRLVGSFSAVRLRTASSAAGALREHIARGLRRYGRWAVIEAASEGAATEGADILDCSLEVPGSAPAIVTLRCEDVNARPVVTVKGSNCRSCFGPLQFSLAGDTRRAGDDLVKSFTEHHVRMERIYGPQLRAAR